VFITVDWGLPDAVPVLTRALSDPEPLVRAHAAWALGEISSPDSLAALRTARAAERDPHVLEELSTAGENLTPHDE
jgi:epoxyqueuosine reductase